MYNSVDDERRSEAIANTPPATDFVTLVTAAANGPPLLGAILSIPCKITAKIAARQGFQWVMIDMEHSPFSPGEVTDIVHIVITSSQGKCFPLIRLPSSSTEWIKWSLDSGAAGIIVPMVHDAKAAEDIVSLARYPPRGLRSFGPYDSPWGDACETGTTYTKYYAKAQAEKIAILPMIESVQGVQNAREIMSVDGVTGVFVGPYDLRLSMGLPGGADGSEPQFVNAMQTICGIAKELGKPVGSMGTGASLAQKRMAQGMRFLLVSFDRTTFANGLVADLNAARQGLEKAVKL